MVKITLQDPDCLCYGDASMDICSKVHCGVDLVLVPNADVQAAALTDSITSLASRADLDAKCFLDLPRAMLAWVKANFDVR